MHCNRTKAIYTKGSVEASGGAVGGDLDGLVEDVLELRHDSGENPLLDHGLAHKYKQSKLIQHTHVAEEAEYLFAPYSAFSVREVV